MTNAKLAKHSFIHSLGVLVYIFLVVMLMQQGEKIFENVSEIWAAMTMLLLLVLSAAVTGLLVLGRPVWLYFSGQKSEALKMFFYTLAWLAGFMVLILVLLVIFH
jgi:SNF family Na+-dependent transporter